MTAIAISKPTRRIVRCLCPLCDAPATFAAEIPACVSTEEWLAELPFEGQTRIHELHSADEEMRP